MSIPCNLSPLGVVGTGVLPVGYMEAEFLGSSGGQYCNVPYVTTFDTGLSVTQRNIGIIGDNNKASLSNADGTSIAVPTPAWKGVNPQTRMMAVYSWSDYCANYIALGVYEGVMTCAINWETDYSQTTVADLIITEDGQSYKKGSYQTTAWQTNGTGLKLAQGNWAIYEAKVSKANVIERHFVAAVDKQGMPCFYDKIGKRAYYNDGTGAFIVGMDMKQARKLSKLPASGGELTVSLPWEAQLVQYNTEVEATLETARSNGWLLKVQYREAEPDGVIYNKYATCASVADLQAVNADYTQDLTADGEWLYPLEKLKTATSVFNGAKELKIWRMNLSAVTSINDGFRESGLTEFNAVISASNINAMLYKCNDLMQIEMDAPNATAAMNAFGSTPARRIKVNLPKLQNGHLLCSGCSNLEDFDGTLPSVTDLTSAFSSSILNKDSVLRIIDSLQSFTDGVVHPLYLGIHVDNNSDEEVLSAIETAEAKGWSVVVRWNGTATAQTASTFGLRRPTIYAKLGNMEFPDGTSSRVLDWGHYVTKWEENGYLEFASVEDAREYFNIEEMQQ